MRAAVSIQDFREIATIVDSIHDKWFDIDQVRFDKGAACVFIPFPADKSQLIIDNAVDLRIADSEQIGKYDFNTIEYDVNRKRLRILTGVPVELEVAVDCFSLRLEPLWAR